MTVEEMQKSLDKIIEMYRQMEKDYGIDLTTKIYNVNVVKDNIPEAIWYAEMGKNL